MTWDLILVGGGLANALIAWRLRDARPDLRVLIVEAGERLGGNHTWSFHDTDVSDAQRAWLAPLIAYRWPGHEVRFAGARRRLSSGYNSITSDLVHQRLVATDGLTVKLGCRVMGVTPTQITLDGGGRLEATAVVDGRGDPRGDALSIRFQKFIGQEVELAGGHGLDGPTIMDGTVEQIDGFRFVYVLPLAADRLLIEDTYYADGGDIPEADLRSRIAAYAQDQDWRIVRVIREEQGALPIVLAGDIDRHWRDNPGTPRSGMRAALFHPTTGYSVPDAVRLADMIAGASDLSSEALYRLTRSFSAATWRRHGFSRMLNRMLFLAAKPDRRVNVMARFYRLDAGLIARFYAGRTTAADKLRILAGRPPVNIIRAMRALPPAAARRREKAA